MMLRCAACISSGSACVIAFSAASRSPLLIASSTVRTAPRSLVRRALLTMVRRAILRVAFLAEVVLAIFSNILRDRSWLAGFYLPWPFNPVIDADMFRNVLFGSVAIGANRLARTASLKEQRRRDCARRH